jgi:DNA-directed RNA polymerase subunit omega
MSKEQYYEKLQEIKEKLKYNPSQGNRFGDYETGDMDYEKGDKVKKITNTQGLRYPSIDDLLEIVDSRYKLAYIAAKRAKIIKSDNYSSVDNLCVKAVGQALEEIQAGKVSAKF